MRGRPACLFEAFEERSGAARDGLHSRCEVSLHNALKANAGLQASCSSVAGSSSGYLILPWCGFRRRIRRAGTKERDWNVSSRDLEGTADRVAMRTPPETPGEERI